jgi:hypothetical protein
VRGVISHRIVLFVLLGVAGVGIVGHSWRIWLAEHPAAPQPRNEQAVTVAPAEAAGPTNRPTMNRELREPEAALPDATDRLAAVSATDPQNRAAAIAALATAPRGQALDILQKVLTSGEPDDRQLALGALRTLALEQGDEDGAIRQALRDVIYDGGDEDVTLGAQFALNEVENALDRQRPEAGQ